MKMEQSCRILEKSWLNETAISMVLEVGSMVTDSFRAPGQFVHIKCGDGLLLRRPISVCTCKTGSPDHLRIVFESRGEGTQWLANRPVGHSINVLGLAGNGFSMNKDGRYLLVGGGIGVPPMLGCAQYTNQKPTAILGFRSRKHTMLLPEFQEACADYLVATDDGSQGHHGYVDALVRKVLERDAQFDGVLACGPKAMLRMVSQAAEAFGIPCQVSMEERMGCGVGACLVCACDMQDGSRKHVCKDGPVFDSKEVNWNV